MTSIDFSNFEDFRTHTNVYTSRFIAHQKDFILISMFGSFFVPIHLKKFFFFGAILINRPSQIWIKSNPINAIDIDKVANKTSQNPLDNLALWRNESIIQKIWNIKLLHHEFQTYCVRMCNAQHSAHTLYVLSS